MNNPSNQPSGPSSQATVQVRDSRQFTPRYSLRTKLIAAFLVVALIPIGVLGLLDNSAIRTALTEGADEKLFNAASQTATSIDTFVNVNLDIVRAEAQLPDLTEYLSLPADERAGTEIEKRARETLNTLNSKNPIFILSYALLDQEGVGVIDTFGADVGTDKSDNDYFQEPLRTGLPYVSPVQFSPVTRREADLYFSSPVRNTAQETIGVLLVHYDATILQQLIAQSAKPAGEESSATLLDENHVRLADTRDPGLSFKSVVPLDPAGAAELKAAGRLPDLPLAELSTNLPDFEQALTNATPRQPSFTGVVYPGEAAEQGAVVKLATRPWLVAFVQARSVFLAPVEDQTRSTLLLATLIAGIVAAVALGVGQLLARPVVHLTTVAQQVAAGDLNIQAPVESRDEIGQLATTFNSMTTQLRETIASLKQQVAERRRAEEAWQESEERYRTIFETTGTATIIVEEDTTIALANVEFERLSGYSREKIEGKKSWTEFVVKQDLERMKEYHHLRRHGEEAAPRSYEFHFIDRYGKTKDIFSTIAMIPGTNKSVASLLEITEHKRAEEEIRRLKEFNEGIVQGVAEALLIEDAAGLITFVNPALEALLGYTADELVGRRWRTIVPQEKVERVQEKTSRRPNGVSEQYETHLLAADGTEIPVIVSARPLFEGETFSGVLSAFTDITERKRAEEMLQQYAERLSILRQIDQAILGARSPGEIAHAVMHHIGKLVPCQRSSVVTFDFEAGEATVLATHAEGKTKIGTGARRPLVAFDISEELWRRGKPRVVEDTLALTDPPLIVQRLQDEGMRSYASVPLMAQDQLIGAVYLGSNHTGAFAPEHVTIAHDIANSLAIAIEQAHLHMQVQNHAIELEQRVIERTAQLEAANRELEAFAYSVSHDLRAPLRHIDGFVRLLLQREEGQLDPNSSHYLNTIAEACNRMGQLIDDLLALSRTGRGEMQIRRVELGELVRQAQQELALDLKNQRIITWEIDPLPAVEGDPVLLRLVWVNLLSNAIKFTAPRSEARIEIGTTRRDVGASGEVTIFVRDNGVGFDPQYAHKLFGVFQRLHRDDEFEGTGIGLATVRRIIHRHGGRVWAEGEVDGGATFYFTLREAA